MYVIYYDDLAVAANNHPDFSIIAGELTQNINAADEFKFTLPPGNPYRGKLEVRRGIITLKRKSEIVFKGDIISIREKFDKSLECVCQGCLAWLNDVCNAKITQASTTQAFFETRMTRYNELCSPKRYISRGNCTLTDTPVSILHENEYTSVFETLSELLALKGGIFLPRYSGNSIYLDYLADKGRTSAQRIVFGENMLDFDNFITADETATAIFPTGKDGINISSVNPTGKAYIVNEALSARYGMISQAVSFDAETPSDLYDAAIEELNSLAVINRSIKLTAIDLSLIDVALDSIEIADDVRVISAPHGLDTTMRCTGKTVDIVNPQNSKIELGKVQNALSKIVSDGGLGNEQPASPSGGVLAVTGGGTGADNTADARANLGFMKSLATASGNGYAVGDTFDIPGADKYTLFLMRTKTTAGGTRVISIIATKTAGGDTIAGVGGQALDNSNGNMQTAQVRMVKSGTQWNLTHCGYITHTAGGSHSASTTLNISEIIGIV